MKKTVTLALATLTLGVLASGEQAHAQRASGARESIPTEVRATRASRAAESAARTARTAAPRASANEAGVIVRRLRTEGRLNPDMERSLARNIVNDTEIRDLAKKITVDTNPANAEINIVILEGLALQRLPDAGTNDALSAMGVSGADIQVAQNAYRNLITGALVEARTWKDTAQIRNVLTFAREANRLIAQGKNELEALRGAQSKLEAESGIKLDIKKINELCKKV